MFLITQYVPTNGQKLLVRCTKLNGTLLPLFGVAFPHPHMTPPASYPLHTPSAHPHRERATKLRHLVPHVSTPVPSRVNMALRSTPNLTGQTHTLSPISLLLLPTSKSL